MSKKQKKRLRALEEKARRMQDEINSLTISLAQAHLHIRDDRILANERINALEDYLNGFGKKERK